MEYFFKELREVERKIAASLAYLVMLDFDGTISPIVAEPNKAKISKTAKALIVKLSKLANVYVAVVSGRGLKDLKNKVDVANIIYAGNHGIEWEIRKKYFSLPINKVYLDTVKLILEKVKKHQDVFPGVLVENKGITASIHYRNVKASKQKLFVKTINLLLKDYLKQKNIRVLYGKKVIELRPVINWNKGKFAEHLIKMLKSLKVKPLVFYVGDDTTDEDALRIVKNGFAVKVGKTKSSAKYFVRNPREVDVLLKKVLGLIETKLNKK